MTAAETSMSALPVVLMCGTTLLAIGCVWLKSKKDQMTKVAESSPFPGIPMPPGGHLLLGHMVAMNIPDTYHGSKQCLLDHADPTTGLTAVWAANTKAFSVLRGSDAKAIFMANKTKPSHSYVGNHLRYLLGNKTMIVLEGKEWKLYRTAVHKSFTPSLLRQSQASINNVGSTLAQSLLARLGKQQQSTAQADSTQQQEYKVYHLMKMATADVFGKCFLGVNFQASSTLELPQLVKSFEFLVEEFQRRVKRPSGQHPLIKNMRAIEPSFDRILWSKS